MRPSSAAPRARCSAAAVVSSAAASTAAAAASSRTLMRGDYRRARGTALPARGSSRYLREPPVVDFVVAVDVSRRDPGTDELPGASMVALTASRVGGAGPHRRADPVHGAAVPADNGQHLFDECRVLRPPSRIARGSLREVLRVVGADDEDGDLGVVERHVAGAVLGPVHE